MLKILVFVVWIGIGPLVLAQSAVKIGSVRSLAMGGGNVFGKGVDALLTNPAFLVDSEGVGAVISVQCRYGTSAFCTRVAGTDFNLFSGRLGVAMGRFGDAQYHEQWMTLAYCRSLGAVSLSFFPQIYQFGVSGGETLLVPALGFGAVTNLGQQTKLAARVTNITQAKMPESAGFPLASEVSLGLYYQPIPNLLECQLSAEKRVDGDLALKAGIEYQAAKPVCLRSGFSSDRQVFTCGIALKAKKILFEYGTEMGGRLGWVHQVGLQTVFPQKQTKNQP